MLALTFAVKINVCIALSLTALSYCVSVVSVCTDMPVLELSGIPVSKYLTASNVFLLSATQRAAAPAHASKQLGWVTRTVVDQEPEPWLFVQTKSAVLRAHLAVGAACALCNKGYPSACRVCSPRPAGLSVQQGTEQGLALSPPSLPVLGDLPCVVRVWC